MTLSGTLVHKAGALALAYAWVVLLPAALRPHWPAFVAAAGGTSGVLTWGAAAVHLTALATSNLAFAALYAARIPAIEAYKGTARAWPWQAADAGKRSDAWALLRWAAAMTAFNHVLAIALAVTNVPLFVARGITVDPAAWPSTPALAAQLLFFMVAEVSDEGAVPAMRRSAARYNAHRRHPPTAPFPIHPPITRPRHPPCRTRRFTGRTGCCTR